MFVTLVKVGKEKFIQEVLLQWGFAVGERDWDQLQTGSGKPKIYSQDSRWRSVHRKLLRGNIEAREIVARPDITGLLLKAR